MREIDRCFSLETLGPPIDDIISKMPPQIINQPAYRHETMRLGEMVSLLRGALFSGDSPTGNASSVNRLMEGLHKITNTRESVGALGYPFGLTRLLGTIVFSPQLAVELLKNQWIGRYTPADQKTGLFLGPPFGANPGSEAWKNARTRFQSVVSFHQNPLLYQLIDCRVLSLVQQLKEAHIGSELDIVPLIDNTTYGIITETILGKEGASYAQELAPLWDLMDREGTKWLLSPSKTLPRPLQEAIQKSDEIAIKAFQAAKNQPEKFESTLLSLLVRDLKEPVSPQHVGGEVRAALFAGHRTVSAALIALTHSFFSLQREDSEFLQIMKAEMKNISSSRDLLNLAKDPSGRKRVFPYSEAFIREVLRQYPPIGLFGRGAAPRCPIQVVGEMAVRPGDMFSFALFSMLHHKMIWKDPERFNPRRFLGKPSLNQKRAMEMIFGGPVPTHCLGEQMTWTILTMFLWSLSHEGLVFEVSENLRANPSLTLVWQPEGGECWVRRRAS